MDLRMLKMKSLISLYKHPAPCLNEKREILRKSNNPNILILRDGYFNYMTRNWYTAKNINPPLLKKLTKFNSNINLTDNLQLTL